MKIGIFDSGIGGLTVLKSILNKFKNIEIFYVADTAYAPYGEKNSFEISDRSIKITNYFLKNHNIDALVVACNTATSASIKTLRDKFLNTLIVGTEPGIKPAIYNTKTCNIGILATPSTLKSDKYQILVNKLSLIKKINLFEQACPGLAMQIEKNKIESKKTYNMLKIWLKPMLEGNVDTIVLGCTHYPLVSKQIKDIMNKNITLIDTSDAISNRLFNLSKDSVYNKTDVTKINIFHTGSINFKIINNILENQDIKIEECEI